ncbi:MAG: hypothetical protein K2O45_03660 [Oscillospiraceae bacterium]|nr:hypothetical protein [Oscillospiraceae bacterium]
MKIKHILGGINWGVIILIAFGGMMLFQSVPEDIIALKPAVSFEDMLDEGVEVKAGAHVSGKVPYVFDAFASEETYTRYSDGSRSGSKASGAYYLVPTAEAFIAMKGRQADVGILDDLIDETWDYMETGIQPKTEFSMEGKTEVLEGQLARYFKEYLMDLGYTEAELEEMGDPLVVRTVNFTACWVMTAIGLVLVLLGVLLFRRGYRVAKYGSGLSRAEDLPDVPVHNAARPFDGADD